MLSDVAVLGWWKCLCGMGGRWLVIWVPATRFASKARGSSLRCEAVYVSLLANMWVL